MLTSFLPSYRQQASLPPPSNLASYEFRLLDQKAKQGDTTIPFELVNKATGERVPDAIVFARRIDMAPDGMPTMTAPLEPEPSGEPGTYRFRTNLAMAGGWQISVAAKVPGEVGTVQGRLLLRAEP